MVKYLKTVKPFKTYQKVLVLILPFALIALAFASGKILDFNFELYDCLVYKYIGIYCPGCGMTRSVIALLHGDILLCIRENIMTLVAAFLLVLLYVELVFRAFGKALRTIVRNNYFLIGILIFWGAYSIARNFIPAIAPIAV